MRIKRPDGRVRRVVLGNTNTQTLRERIATAMMGGTAAFATARWAIQIYNGNDFTGALNTSPRPVTDLSRSGAVVTLECDSYTARSGFASTVRPGTVRAAQALFNNVTMSSVTGLNEVISDGDEVTLSWQWTFSGLVSSANTNAALLAAGGTSSWDWSDTRAQYSIQSSASVWRHRGEPSRNGASIEYETPNAVLSNSSNLTVYWWRVVRNATGSTEVVSRQALNRVVQAGARATGTWSINVV